MGHGILGVVRALVVAVPHVGGQALGLDEGLEPVEARAALARPLPEQVLLDAALSPLDPATDGLAIVGLLHEALLDELLLLARVEGGDVQATAADGVGLGLLDEGDLSALLGGGDGGAAAGKAGADHQDAGVDGLGDLVGGNVLGDDVPAPRALVGRHGLGLQREDLMLADLACTGIALRTGIQVEDLALALLGGRDGGRAGKRRAGTGERRAHEELAAGNRLLLFHGNSPFHTYTCTPTSTYTIAPVRRRVPPCGVLPSGVLL